MVRRLGQPLRRADGRHALDGIMAGRRNLGLVVQGDAGIGHVDQGWFGQFLTQAVEEWFDAAVGHDRFREMRYSEGVMSWFDSARSLRTGGCGLSNSVRQACRSMAARTCSDN